MNLSVLIMTFNEEHNILAAIGSVDPSVPVIVIDSGSSDATIDLAQAARSNVTIIEHQPFEGHGPQLNWALRDVITSQWVFILDADERLAVDKATLAAAINLAERRGDSGVAFRRDNYFGSRLLKHGGFAPDWQVRLMRRSVRYEDKRIHAHVMLSRRQIVFWQEGRIVHFTYRDPADYIRRYGRYLVLEALESGSGSARPRFAWIRARADLIPFPGLARFLYAYVVRSGWRDGLVGFYLAWWAGSKASVKRGVWWLSRQSDLCSTARPRDLI